MIRKIRLAITEAGLEKGSMLYAWRLPIPTLSLYNDHSTKIPLSDGGQALRGFASVSLTWDRLTWDQARTVRKLVEDAIDGGGLLYASVNRGWNRSGGADDWIDVSGKPHIPDGTAAGNTQGRVSDGVSLLLNALSVVNDPSSYA